MKTIVLIPTKNEEWILNNTLLNITPYVDTVIIADQKSFDNTVSIAKSYSNVQVIENPYEGHSNKVRWLLLEEARKYGKNNLIICIDADEILQPRVIKMMQDMVVNGSAKPGDVFKYRWIQLYKSVYSYRNDGAWKDTIKNIAFIDNEGVNEYKKDFVINDHTSRVPDSHINSEIYVDYPLLHYHFVAWKRNEMKQAWYRCTELIAGKRNAKRINNTYRVTMLNDSIPSYTSPTEWYEGLTVPQNIESAISTWHLEEILKFFSTYGILFFEDLQIWHIPELKKDFITQVGREPVSKTYPKILVWLNEIKNWIRNHK